MINKKCKVGKKTLAARRIAAILMTCTLAGTLAADMISVQNGAKIIRVHDVSSTIDTLNVMKNLR